ncbi:hypothetical protein LLH23_12640 [bacterium]|nr:hypothetical protein [bacterium]
MTVLRIRERCARGLLVASLYLIVVGSQTTQVLAGPAVTRTTPAAAPSSATPPNPFSFAPAPFALPVANAALDRQLTALLRGFRPIQKSEVLLSGEAGRDLSAQIVVQLRPGETLDLRTLQSLVQLILGAVPGLAPERLNIASADGRMLVTRGQVQAERRGDVTAPLGPLLPGALVGTALVIAVGVAAVLRRGWRRQPDDPLDALILRDGGRLAGLLQGERPEVRGLVVSLAGPRAGRWLQRELGRRQVEVGLPTRPTDARVARALVHELQERLNTGT